MIDRNPTVNDPANLLRSAEPRLVARPFQRGSIKPRLRTGHFQGIQQLPDALDGTRFFLMTRNAWSGAFLYVVAYPPGQSGRIVAKHALPSDGRSHPLHHPGGFQAAGQVAAIGLEDERGKRRSQIQFWDLTDPLAPRQLEHLLIRREGTHQGAKTAGSAGICRWRDKHLLVVGNWGSRVLDFYVSNGKALGDDSCRFDPLALWESETDRTAWKPDDTWGNHQNLNLLTDRQGKLHLIGLHREEGHDFADLFDLDLVGTAAVLTRTVSKHVILSSHCTFQHAGGVHIGTDRLSLLAGPVDIGLHEMALNVSP